MLSLDLGSESLQFINIVEMYEKVLPFEWNSFCISLSIEKILLIHNGRVQGRQSLAEEGIGKHLKTMKSAVIGGAKFIGILSDLQIFGRDVSETDLKQWTECGLEVLKH